MRAIRFVQTSLLSWLLGCQADHRPLDMIELELPSQLDVVRQDVDRYTVNVNLDTMQSWFVPLQKVRDGVIGCDIRCFIVPKGTNPDASTLGEYGSYWALKTPLRVGAFDLPSHVNSKLNLKFRELRWGKQKLDIVVRFTVFETTESAELVEIQCGMESDVLLDPRVHVLVAQEIRAAIP
jgi:hypothetical protein